jgi:hypothetical protein
MALTPKDRKGLTIIGLVAAALVALLLASHKYKPEDRDKLGCLLTGAPSSTVILLDHSEGVPAQTSTEIEKRVIDFINKRVETNGRISIYAVSDTSSAALMSVYEGCKLPSSGNDITNSDKAIRIHFEKRFLAKLRPALREQYSDASTSPIAQAISDLSVSQDLRLKSNNLLIFSDMIENSSALDMYHCPPGADPRAIYRRNNAGAIERPTFDNVNVSIHIIPRRGITQETLQCRNHFWPWFLGDNAGGQAGVKFDYLPG